MRYVPKNNILLKAEKLVGPKEKVMKIEILLIPKSRNRHNKRSSLRRRGSGEAVLAKLRTEEKKITEKRESMAEKKGWVRT